MGNMDWIDEQEKVIEEKKSEGYFTISEGDNVVQLLTHCAPLAQVWEGNKYRIAVEGDKNVNIKGLCWLLHDGKIKQAKLPYTVLKAIREYQKDPDYAFSEFPMPRKIKIKAKNAGSKEVEYSVIPSPKESEVPQEILTELATKPTPEEIIEKIKGTVAPSNPKDYKGKDYPLNEGEIPF